MQATPDTFLLRQARQQQSMQLMQQQQQQLHQQRLEAPLGTIRRGSAHDIGSAYNDLSTGRQQQQPQQQLGASAGGLGGGIPDRFRCPLTGVRIPFVRIRVFGWTVCSQVGKCSSLVTMHVVVMNLEVDVQYEGKRTLRCPLAVLHGCC